MINLQCIENVSSYRAVNTLRLGYETSQLMLFVLRSIQNTQIHCVGRTLNCGMLNWLYI